MTDHRNLKIDLQSRKISFLHLPTPLEYLENVSSDLGIEVYAKRDDLTNLATGGNKLRKLEYLIKDALDKGATVITTVGSQGTYSGLLAGLVNEESPLRLKGILIAPVDPDEYDITGGILSEYAKAKELYGFEKIIDKSDIDIETAYSYGGYNNAVAEVREAIYYMARKEAIILDPCYTGKTFAAIMKMAAEGKIGKGEKVIFMHTGGYPGLYTGHHRVEFERELMEYMHIDN
jgi:D-cysteine desulfhydrase